MSHPCRKRSKRRKWIDKTIGEPIYRDNRLKIEKLRQRAYNRLWSVLKLDQSTFGEFDELEFAGICHSANLTKSNLPHIGKAQAKRNSPSWESAKAPIKKLSRKNAIDRQSKLNPQMTQKKVIVLNHHHCGRMRGNILRLTEFGFTYSAEFRVWFAPKGDVKMDKLRMVYPELFELLKGFSNV